MPLNNKVFPTQTTIAACATPPGFGGVGIIRISGERVRDIAKAILSKVPQPRQALFTPFLDKNKSVIDEGIALFFPGPQSFTGEDVLELQGHGGPVVIDLLLNRVVEAGAQLAKPGEFSERAFLNEKLDLTQAEAIADLIVASTKQAAQAAMRSLQGEFSKQIELLASKLIELRMHIEAAIDFSDEEIDFIAEPEVKEKLSDVQERIDTIFQSAKQGSLLSEGVSLVIMGKPNAGKSSLLNLLVEQERAIVTEIPGTTRDILKETIHIDGLPLHIIDTAGVRDREEDVCPVEKEGIKRTWEQAKKADHVFVICDASLEKDISPFELFPELKALDNKMDITLIRNKIDLTKEKPSVIPKEGYQQINISVKEKQGIDNLHQYLKNSVGYEEQTGDFLARRRHLVALKKVKGHIETTHQQLNTTQAGELMAQELTYAHQALGEITGVFTTDDLLDNIFRNFCIGK